MTEAWVAVLKRAEMRKQERGVQVLILLPFAMEPSASILPRQPSGPPLQKENASSSVTRVFYM